MNGARTRTRTRTFVYPAPQEAGVCHSPVNSVSGPRAETGLDTNTAARAGPADCCKICAPMGCKATENVGRALLHTAPPSSQAAGLLGESLGIQSSSHVYHTQDRNNTALPTMKHQSRHNEHLYQVSREIHDCLSPLQNFYKLLCGKATIKFTLVPEQIKKRH